MLRAVQVGDMVKVWKIERVTTDGLSSKYGEFETREEAEAAIKQANEADKAHAYDRNNY